MNLEQARTHLVLTLQAVHRRIQKRVSMCGLKYRESIKICDWYLNPNYNVDTEKIKLVLALQRQKVITAEQAERMIDAFRENNMDMNRDLQDCIEAFYAKQNPDIAIFDLHMFFSPLRLPPWNEHDSWLRREQVLYCLELYKLIYPSEADSSSIVIEGRLIELQQAINTEKSRVIMTSDFSRYLSHVLQAKIEIKNEHQEFMKMWEESLKSMSPEERRQFVKEYGDRFPWIVEMSRSIFEEEDEANKTG